MLLLLMANIKNYKQLSLISYIANVTVLVAIASVCVDGTYTMIFRDVSLDVKYFEF